ncbi:YceI family protein [Variovorax sp. J31P179]|uniref:YceI family protein n=1 Tax=Variovorax sp. J31P179 TaxID=3053508 RepID=UPI0025778AC7|nr:YceI family protein [Variovorax sp. J31P179]MDM0082379.1 YceI family protein [Variovorax sp. J31P179]
MAAPRTAGIAWLAAGAVAAVLAVAACAPLVRETAPPAAAAKGAVPEGFPAEHYARGEAVYRIDSARSLVAITVRRGGSLGHLGHDHIVASRAVQGYVAPREGRADLFIPLAELTVDEPALRAEAGLDTQPSESDIAGTRSNMLDKVLEVQRFPFATLRVDRPVPDGPLAVAIMLHGVRRSFTVPAPVARSPGEISVAGTLEFNQSDFGIAPFSILGGAIQVQDRLSLRFSILATAPSP